jgi:hypothetical protein
VSELRALYCYRYRPKDGVEVYSELYEQGFPREGQAPTLPALPPDHLVTADAEFERDIRSLAQRKAFPEPKRLHTMRAR